MGLCACVGPQGNDPLCPCQMLAAGREPTPVWKPGDREELQRVLAENEARFREPPCMVAETTVAMLRNLIASIECGAVQVIDRHGEAEGDVAKLTLVLKGEPLPPNV